jgi:hypothetical protein
MTGQRLRAQEIEVMANKSVIVIKKPGEIITKAYVERLCKEYTTYMGSALVYENELVIDHQKGKPTVEAVMALQDSFKDHQLVLVFGENKTILEEDMQPFKIEVDKDVHIALVMEGTFEGYAVPKSTHTDEWHCKEDFLAKKLPKLFKTANANKTAGLADYGVAPFLAELEDPITQQDLSNCWTSRGFIALLSTAGPAVSISNKGHVFKADYNWGTTSNSMNYVEQTVTKPVEKVAEAAKPLTRLQQLQAKMKGEKVETEGPPAPKDLPAEKKAETALPVNEDEWELYSLPAEALKWSNSTKKSHWTAEIGYVPEGYKHQSTKVKRRKGTKLGILAPLAASNVKDAATPITAEEVVSAMKVDPKTLPDKAEPQKDTSIHSPVSAEVMPILSPLQKHKIKTEWAKTAEVLKILGDDHKTTFDPKLLQSLEEKYANVMGHLGFGDLYDTANWPFYMFMSLGQQDVKALAILAFNYRNEMLKNTLVDPAKKIITPQRAVM